MFYVINASVPHWTVEILTLTLSIVWVIFSFQLHKHRPLGLNKWIPSSLFMTSIRSWAPDHTSIGEVTLLSLGKKSQLLIYRFMVMTKENPAPKAKPIISKKAIIVPAVSACFGSTVLGKRERKRKKKWLKCTFLMMNPLLW